MQSGLKIQSPIVLDDCFDENGLISIALDLPSTEIILAPVQEEGISILEYPKKSEAFIQELKGKMKFILQQYCKINKVEEIGFEMKIRTNFPMASWSQSLEPILLLGFGINKHYKRPMGKRKLLQFLQENIASDKNCSLGASMVGGFCFYDDMHQKTHRLISPQGVQFTVLLSDTIEKEKNKIEDPNRVINLVHGLNIGNWDLIKSGFSSVRKSAFVKEVENQIEDKEYLGGGELFENKGLFFVSCNSRTSEHLENTIYNALKSNNIKNYRLITAGVHHDGIWFS